MAFIDGSVVTIALPVLQRELGAAAAGAAVGGERLHALPGRADPGRRRRRRPLRPAAASSSSARCVFAAASAACALAPGAAALIAARSVQGRRRGADGAAEPRDHLRLLPAGDPRPGDRHLGRRGLDHHRARAGGRRLPDRQRSAGARPSGSTCRSRSAVLLLARSHIPESRAPVAGPLDWPGGLLAVAASALVTLGLTAIGGEAGARLDRRGADRGGRRRRLRLRPGRAPRPGAADAALALRRAAPSAARTC